MDGIQGRITDTSSQALDLPFLPASLGLRTQALKLQFVTAQDPGQFLIPKLGLSDVARQWTQADRAAGFHQVFIGETSGQIWAPYSAADKLIDAIVNQPVSATAEQIAGLMHADNGACQWRIRFLPTLCPGCGWDMQGATTARILICPNCQRGWQASRGHWREVTFAVAAGGQRPRIYLPFWRIQAHISGVALDSRADLARLANLPVRVDPAWEKQQVRFWIPAFKIRPRLFLGLCHRLTVAQLRVAPRPAMKSLPSAMAPATLPVSEASQAVKLCVAALLKPRWRWFPKLDTIQATANRYLLIYLPFEQNHHELIEPNINMCIPRKALELAYWL